MRSVYVNGNFTSAVKCLMKKVLLKLILFLIISGEIKHFGANGFSSGIFIIDIYFATEFQMNF
jgi:hypothetical protein